MQYDKLSDANIGDIVKCYYNYGNGYKWIVVRVKGPAPAGVSGFDLKEAPHSVRFFADCRVKSECYCIADSSYEAVSVTDFLAVAPEGLSATQIEDIYKKIHENDTTLLEVKWDFACNLLLVRRKQPEPSCTVQIKNNNVDVIFTNTAGKKATVSFPHNATSGYSLRDLVCTCNLTEASAKEFAKRITNLFASPKEEVLSSTPKVAWTKSF